MTRDGVASVPASRIPRLLQRRVLRARWIFVVMALPLILFGLMGAEHGALLPYATLAGVCLLQFFYPTLLVWGFLLVLYAVGSVVYVYTLAADALRVMRNQKPEVLLNPYDTAFFLALVGVLVALTIILARNKPTVG
jgi:hypothetical protein